ncbi:sodium/iodide cotransporter-like [Rhipicephalus microplus]|uniref:sodium/iodide cotransporter-like n=1 Tax=Rhipicephalus microplus TaxID=6941 RepID=UPI003F6CADDD
MHPTKDLDIYDCVVFGVLTVVGYLVGLYFSFARRRHQKTSRVGNGKDAEIETFLGGQTLPAIALAMSVVASVANGVNVVSFVGHYYAHGFHSIWVVAGTLVASTLTVTAVVPLLYALRVASIFQYLRLRFDNKVGITACLVYFVLSIKKPTDVSARKSLREEEHIDAKPTPISAQGSPKPSMNDQKTMNFDITSDDNFWSCLIGGLPYIMVRMGFDQMVVQRYMAARNLRSAKTIAITGAAFVLFFFLLIAIAAVYLIQWYRDCDPYVIGAISSYDQILSAENVFRKVE